MCIIRKIFHYEETGLPVIKRKDDIWFRGKTIAEILKYADQRKAIRDHVDPEDRGNESFSLSKGIRIQGVQNGPPNK